MQWQMTVLIEKEADGFLNAFGEMTTNRGCYGPDISNAHLRWKLDEF